MDLQKLSRTTDSSGEPDDPGQAAGRVPAPRRRWGARLVLPAAILLATLLLIGYASRDLILPAEPGAVGRAVALPRGAAEGEGARPDADRSVPASVIAQAPGWVEPDPYPIYVSALAPGVVREVLVLEGETVAEGQPLVRLVEADAELDLARARAELAGRRAALAAAQADYQEPTALVRAEAVAEARVSEAQAALTRLDAEIAKEAARLAELTAAYERLTSLTERSVSALQVDAAKYQVQSQQAVVAATRQRKPGLEAARRAAEATHAAAKRDLERKIVLRRALDDAKAAVQAAEARVEEAELRLSRMTIKSPTAGVVMARLVAPGAKLMLTGDSAHSAHALHLYDPARLQVRVDVPLSDAAAIGVGLRAKINVDVLPDVAFDGQVTRLVHQADISKNTVQFKVAIEDPSPLLKPDMLARVKFLGGSGAPPGATAAASAGTTRVAVQRSAIVDADEPAVWWVSPLDRHLERRPVTLGRELGDGRVVVEAGLNPGDVIVDRPGPDLEEGQRVRYRDPASAGESTTKTRDTHGTD